jgi:hypothetical protein
MCRDLAEVGRRAGATVNVWDLSDVPLEVCIERDSKRFEMVGSEVITGMHLRYLAGKTYPLPLPEESGKSGQPDGRYEPPPEAPLAIMVDIDGTLALHGTRSPFDETRVHEDRPNLAVIACVQALDAAGYKIIYCSGRTEGCRVATEAWLEKWVVSLLPGTKPWEALHMRPIGDVRKDALVKREIFDREIREQFNVLAVLDDRQQVVDAWRELGLTVFQVAPGDF